MTGMINEWGDQELAELKKVFFSQAYELTEEVQDELLKLEADGADEETLKTLKRHVHTLKGDSNSMGYEAIGALCHRMEDVLSAALRGAGVADHEAVDLLLACIDSIHAMLTECEAGNDACCAQDLTRRIDGQLGQTAPAGTASPISLASEYSEYEELLVQDALTSGKRVYTIVAKFHPECREKSVASLMLAQRLGTAGKVIRSAPDLEHGDFRTVDVLTVAFAADLDLEAVKRETLAAGMIESAAITEQAPSKVPGPRPDRLATASKSETLRVDASKVDAIMNLVGELIIGRSMIEQATKDILDGSSPVEAAARLFSVNASLERVVSDLQKGVMKMRMVPLYHVFRKFPKMVRDLSLEKGKRVKLDVVGSEVELDKGIVDALGEPLAHIMRNLIDHGIESPEARRAAGKPEEGVIRIKAYHEASQLVIEASDDGRGIDAERLKRKAVESGFLTTDEAAKLSVPDAVNLIFLSGLSTAEAVSETSGRGVGMDAVKNAVNGLKGSLTVETAAGAGTLFRMRLPLTLAVIKALLFEVGDRLYAVPVPVVAEVAQIAPEDLVTVEGRKTLLLRDQIISVISAAELFRIEESGKRKKHVLILSMGAKKAGLLIDRLVGQQELVIKAVDDDLVGSDLVAGASILGSGRVVLILDAQAMFSKAVGEEKKKRLVAS